ncbi:MAG: peptide ABC transporter ATP-binding protein [Candidatus Kerfeldbacteria bacterium RIFCSPHIGHO2_12_FULL_48_17]|uniref:Peptide ABC transporter ATP-binding protein n=1 Tax=Candidatus Kerfeldbacteria bacterium RIFCSPHIGHO2_12_FULL_48_17 TaxID=1798542 RepID=A0A1G2AXL8_9BACT|nr:MAG: peptide ABC transporter ATP-binding protein [Candidatus Kerfeldbacteria bacterium RIFCSPHIGHO2_12_FULL_48_17]
MEDILTLKDLKKTYNIGKYGSFDVLKKINLRIRKGEFIAIMGPSGAGKSTLLHMIGLLDRPNSGEVVIDDHNIEDLSNRELALLRRKKVGFVFQSFNLMPRMTALNNVLLPAVYAKKPRRERIERAQELLKKVGLENRMHHKSSEMSGGEKQRVAIARALMNDPDIILADEPTGNLDSASGEGVMKLFHKLHKEGKTIIAVTHDTSIAKQAERIVQIKDGKIISK